MYVLGLSEALHLLLSLVLADSCSDGSSFDPVTSFQYLYAR